MLNSYLPSMNAGQQPDNIFSVLSGYFKLVRSLSGSCPVEGVFTLKNAKITAPEQYVIKESAFLPDKVKMLSGHCPKLKTGNDIERITGGISSLELTPVVRSLSTPNFVN